MSRTRRFSLVLLLCCLALPTPSRAAPSDEGITPIIPLLSPGEQGYPFARFQPDAACPDTVWIGHKPATYQGVWASGVWDFDQDVAGSDSTQGWTRLALPYWKGSSLAAVNRPQWAFDYGNTVNDGNSNLFLSRLSAGREYRTYGVAGVWHVDTMAGVKRDPDNGPEASALPIAGVASAWCGLRQPGSLIAIDALTGNALNGDLQRLGTENPAARPEYPGYSDQWDQMLYKDFPSNGAGTVAFRFRCELSPLVDPVSNGSGWFNPDPTTIANFVNGPADSFMAYAGSPSEIAFDTNRRWFSEVLDFNQPVRELYATSYAHPVVGGDTSVVFPFSGLTPVAGNIRVVFRVKTNRVESDESTNLASGFNSKDGAAVIDNVQISGGTVYGFESAGSITARSLIPNLAAAASAWATTGRPPAEYGHIENLANIIYEDVNGTVGSNTRMCNMVGNVLVFGDHDNSEQITIESNQALESPTVDLAVRNAGTGTINGQNISVSVANRTSAQIALDWYSGFASLDESVFLQLGLRYHAPDVVSPVGNVREWSPILLLPAAYTNPIPTCSSLDEDVSGIGVPIGSVDSLRIDIVTETMAFAFAGTNLGNTRGTYVDNVRLGLFGTGGTDCLVKKLPETEPGPNTGPFIVLVPGQQLQDAFPVNEGVTPVDGTPFDTTTALVKSAMNIAPPPTGAEVVLGDSMLAYAFGGGDGVTTGTRLDLIFRIDPGPGNYLIKGDRTSPLIERDSGHPFWAAYQADCGAWGTNAGGTYGTPQGSIDNGVHAAGTRWNKDWWNSCRMDTAEINLWPILSRGLGLPSLPRWMATIFDGTTVGVDKAEPKFAALGISHLACFLINKSGAVSNTNIDCGTPGASPPSSGYTSATDANWGSPFIDAVASRKEGTKILPDGYFSPGTHIEYFLRSSTIQDPAGYRLAFDTTRVFPQGWGGALSFQDQERYLHMDVLPDLWKSTRFGGAGLACMLMVDAADRRGSNAAFRGMADTLGFGKNNGASQGWKRKGFDFTHPNNPAEFVAANLGQYGLSFDQYDITGAETYAGGRLGNRLAHNPPGGPITKVPTSGPSLPMLSTFYNTIVYGSGDLSVSTMHDGQSANRGSDDVTLLDTYLNGASASDHRSLWLSGDGLAEDVWNNTVTGLSLLETDTGTDFWFGNYNVFAPNSASIVELTPTAPWAPTTVGLGLQAGASGPMDVLTTTLGSGGSSAMDYPPSGSQPHMASVYWGETSGRFVHTLVDGFDFARLRGIRNTTGSTGTALSLLSQTDLARHVWFDRAIAGYFAHCARKGPLVDVGDLPGGGETFAAALLAPQPNPVPGRSEVTFRWSLDRARAIGITVYSVSGRRMAHLDARGVAGVNALAWNRKDAAGAMLPPGVYLYTIAADGQPLSGARNKVVLLGP